MGRGQVSAAFCLFAIASVWLPARQPLLPGAAVLAGATAGAIEGDSHPPTTHPATSLPLQGQRIETIEHDFGKTWAGDTIKHAFKIANPTDRVLQIRDVSTTCGCTTTSKWERQAPPGEVWSIEISLVTTGRKGPMHKVVRVRTDDPDRPVIHLALKGDVQPRFEISPTAVNFGALQTRVPARRTLTITNRTGRPVRLIEAQPSTKLLKTELRELDEGQRYELVVETVPPLPESSSLGTITVETDLKEQPRLTVPVYGAARPRVYLSPKTISVPVPSVGDIQRTLQLMVSAGDSVKVMDVEASHPSIRVVPPADTQAVSQRIQVTVPRGLDVPPDGETITVYTDDPEFSKLTCQLRPFQLRPTSRPRPATSGPVAQRQRYPNSIPTSHAAASQPVQPGQVR